VGYGADPVAVLELIEAHAERGAIVLLGNHDAAARGDDVRGLNAQASVAIAWTRRQLRKRQQVFLRSLPLSVREDDRLFVHASAAVPERWTYVTGPRQAALSMEAADAAVVFCGHVHDQGLYFMSRAGRAMPFRPTPSTPVPMGRQHRWLAIVGSAGQPRDRNAAAAYALADLERRRITFFRVGYDFEAAAQKIRRAGLPERLARRLERGM
jgi:diadenosine tetraphosphatase ApaH/serine/threonine PP2A family protein phosphatase